MPVEVDCQEIFNIAEDIKRLKFEKERFIEYVNYYKNNEEAIQQILRGKHIKEYLDYYNNKITELLDRIENIDQRIIAEFETEVPSPTQRPLEVPSELRDLVSIPSPSRRSIGKGSRKKFLKASGIDEKALKRVLTSAEKSHKIEIPYTVYSANFYGKLSGQFFGDYALSIARNHKRFFTTLYNQLRASDIKLLSVTYISTMIFSSFLAFALFGLLAFVISIFLEVNPLFAALTSLSIGILAGLVTFTIFYIYPSTVVNSRSRQIKNELPFAIIHMAAVAGSGAQPISMFKLLLNSGEYKALEPEIKKIVNYVNLFGYDLSTALKTVASTTPSKRFKDLLTGITATIESGGSLKSYLQGIADETMNTYRLERKKYVETLSTYSDIYTGVLIAAPLLFIVTLAIINVLGGTIAGISVKTLSVFGTYAVIPFLNLAFILFLNIVQPEA